jgi:aromatic-L-amino-acid/L-tryptophan decarboxylase
VQCFGSDWDAPLIKLSFVQPLQINTTLAVFAEFAHADYGYSAMFNDVETPPNLDPDNWDEFRHESHRALDQMIDHLQCIRDIPVWQNASASVRQQFSTALPQRSTDLHDVLSIFNSSIRPYANGNLHPLFMGWVHGAGSPVGMIAEMLAAGLNSNCGGRNHIGLVVEQQIVQWAIELFGFPTSASGIFVTGTSSANFLAMLVARTATLGEQVRQVGLVDCRTLLTAYTSNEAHACIVKAAELSGIGARHVRQIPVDSRGAMRIDALADAVDKDRRDGFRPFIIIGTAGTVNTGAFDNLNELAAICREQELWFHVDGAFGALCALSPNLRHLIEGIEYADSIAFDFHKWAHVPYDAGFLLVRDSDLHRRTFSNPADYLSRASSGLAAGEIWPCDLGADLSRGFRALKTWFTFQVFGAQKIGACIEHTCLVARYLAQLITNSELFEVCAPVALNIVCFGLKTCADGKMNEQIVIDLQERGVAAPSTTIVNGKTVIRAAIVNHRTTEKEMDSFLSALHDSALRIILARMGDRSKSQGNASVAV